MIKTNGNHVYERDIDFKEYYNYYVEERNKYKDIISKIEEFETHFKAITSYIILIHENLVDSDCLETFFDQLKLNNTFTNPFGYSQSRIDKMNKTLDEIKSRIFKYADIYCFFDRLSLGELVTIYLSIDADYQKEILKELKRFNQNLNVVSISQFADRIFTLVSIRNCVMHCNSLTVLIRFYDAKNKTLRTVSDKKRYTKLIEYLCNEKTHE